MNNAQVVKNVLDSHLKAKKYSHLITPIPAFLFSLIGSASMTNWFREIPSIGESFGAIFFAVIALITSVQTRRIYTKKMGLFRDYVDSPEDFIQDLRQAVTEQKAKSFDSKMAPPMTLEEQLLIALGKDEKIHNKHRAKEALLRRIYKMYLLDKWTIPVWLIASLFLPVLYLIVEYPVDVVNDMYFYWFVMWGTVFLLGLGIPIVLMRRRGRKVIGFLDTDPEQARLLLEKAQKKLQKNRLIDKSQKKQNAIAQMQLMELFDTVVRRDTIADHPEDYK